MRMGMTCLWATLMIPAVGGCGGAPLAPNSFRLVATQPGVRSVSLLHFKLGGYAFAGRNGVVLLKGDKAVVMFDYKGRLNRFDVLLREADDFALYERIGQRPFRTPAADAIVRPVGVCIDRENGHVRGSVDVFVSRSERREVDTAFERFPDVLRVVGFFLVPEEQRAPGGVMRASSFLEPEDLSTTSPQVPAGLYEADFRELFDELGGALQPLPLMDVQMLVPTHWAQRFVRRWSR